MTVHRRRTDLPGPIGEMAFWALYSYFYDVLTALQPYRAMLAAVAAEVADHKPTNLLDVGFGTGNVVEVILKAGYLAPEVCFGVDNNPAMLRRASRKLPRCQLRLAPATELPFGDKSFDIVVASNVLYTIGDAEQAVSEMFRVLRPGGRLIVTTPRENPDIGAIRREHVHQDGWPSLLRCLPALMVVGLLNLRIVRNATYHFYTQKEIGDLLGTPTRISLTYADQAWLAVAKKKEG